MAWKIQHVEQTPAGRFYCCQANDVLVCIGPSYIVIQSPMPDGAELVACHPDPDDMAKLYEAAGLPAFRLGLRTQANGNSIIQLRHVSWAQSFEIDPAAPERAAWGEAAKVGRRA